MAVSRVRSVYMRSIKVGSRVIQLTHEDKVLFSQSGITKGDLIDYYERIASTMILHIKDRPLTMHRFVHGIDQEGFYQKDASDYFPAWIKRVPIEKQDGGIVEYVLANDAATLVYLANQLCITMHVWPTRVDHLNYPDRMIFDLDPSPGVGFAAVRWTAKKIKTLLDECGLPNFVMTTGSRGVHVVVPLKPIHAFDEVREYARSIAQLLANRHPEKCTTEMRKAKRGKRVFIDVLRNAFGLTGVAPYSVRAKKGAPIATPIEWDELLKKGVTPQKYTIKNIFRRLARKKDPWHNINQYACSLKSARKK
jgi:bifunctional non-homologous end joining protein LigD